MDPGQDRPLEAGGVSTSNQRECDSGFSLTPPSKKLNSDSSRTTPDPDDILGGRGDSEAGPDVAEDEEFRSASEVFRDPAAFDFLSQHGQRQQGQSSAAAVLARESLYVKFDPLIGGRPSILPSKKDRDDAMRLAEEEERLEEEEKQKNIANLDLIAINSPSPMKSKSQIVLNSNDNDLDRTPVKSALKPSNTDNISISKKEAKSTTQVHNGDSNSNPNDTTDSHNRQFLDLQEQLLRKDRQLEELEKIIQESLTTIEALKIENNRRRDSEEQMKQVMKEYEKTISELIAQKEREKLEFEQERDRAIQERDQAAEDLKNVEAAFADVHRKYERTKSVVEGFKQNEETLKAAIEEYAQRTEREEQKYELLKRHAEETLEKANQEIENVARGQDSEMARLTAMLKKAEMKASSLEQTVEQKAKENEELTAICDELIAKVGTWKNVSKKIVYEWNSIKPDDHLWEKASSEQNI